MANNNGGTIFQRLKNTLIGNSMGIPSSTVNSYTINDAGKRVIATANSREEYEKKLKQAKQNAYLSKSWLRTNYQIEADKAHELNEVRMMYRDCDIMDGFPEIGTALDIYSEETTCLDDEGFMISVTAKSDRVRSILNDLFVNRLNVNVILPMITRTMCKYGNSYMLLNIDKDNGVKGWTQMPVHEMERYEHGMVCPYTFAPTTAINNLDGSKLGDTKFIWVGKSQYSPYMSWQMAHFRLLYDSQFLPYGCSILHKARRHFRMLSMMEDMMLIYRLDRSVERRVFKVNVGSINQDDVPAYIEQVANSFKRVPIIDPNTGQVDLRKGVMMQTEDFFIPVRDPGEPSPIETLPGGQNLTAMDDINYVQNKICTALRVPKSFLNFEEEKGDGKNLALLDVRFTRTVNRVQQALLMELNKIAIIHLFFLGLTDDLTDFTLTMSNPSSQAEMLELDNMAKKITTAKDAVSDLGKGMSLTSVRWALKHIMKWSDKDIQRNLEEQRLETALAFELQNTQQIIKRTGLFDSVDNIYGEPGAEYMQNPQGGDPNGGPMGGFGGGGGLGGPPIGGGGPIGGGDIDFGDDSFGGGDMANGTPGEMDMNMNTAEDNATMGGDLGGGPDSGPMGGNNGPGLGEQFMHRLETNNKEKRVRLNETINKRKRKYTRMLNERRQEKNENGMYSKIKSLNEDMERMLEDLKLNEIGKDKNDND